MEEFNSKILLFGEYTILYGSNALSIPFNRFSGKFDFLSAGNNKAIELNKQLAEFYNFLQKNHLKFDYLNLDRFRQELDDGLYFNSTIPGNYGLGSSGAVTAAVFGRYHFLGDSVTDDPGQLRILLSNLESWFHGRSSGVDHLVSFLNKPLLVSPQTVQIVEIPKVSDKESFKMFLIDSGQESSTGFQIRSFQQILKNRMFYMLFLEKYMPYINSAITFFLENNHVNFDSILADIVDFQYKYLKTLFPASVRELIKYGLDERKYYLKLCGSGGGGYLLGFTQEVENTQKLLADKNVSLIEI